MYMSMPFDIVFYFSQLNWVNNLVLMKEVQRKIIKSSPSLPLYLMQWLNIMAKSSLDIKWIENII